MIVNIINTLITNDIRYIIIINKKEQLYGEEKYCVITENLEEIKPYG